MRLARATLTLLSDDARAPSPVLDLLATLCEEAGLVPDNVPSPMQSLAVFQRTLIAGLADRAHRGIAFSLAAFVRAAGQIRDRLSADHWRLAAASVTSFEGDCARTVVGDSYSTDEAIAALGRLAVHLSAIIGAQVDHMTRDDGWRLMTIGRYIERLGTLARVLQLAFDDRRPRARRRPRLRAATVRQHDHLPGALPAPARSAAADRPAGAGVGQPAFTARHRPAPVEPDRTPRRSGCGRPEGMPAGRGAWPELGELGATDAAGRYARLLELTARLAGGSHALSNAISARYFSHAFEEFRAVNA